MRHLAVGRYAICRIRRGMGSRRASKRRKGLVGPCWDLRPYSARPSASRTLAKRRTVNLVTPRPTVAPGVRVARFSNDESAARVPQSDWTQRPVVSSRPVGSTPPNQGRRPARSGVEHRPKAMPAGPDRCRRAISAPLRDDPARRRRACARRRYSRAESACPPRVGTGAYPRLLRNQRPAEIRSERRPVPRRGSPFHPPPSPRVVWWSRGESRTGDSRRSMGFFRPRNRCPAAS
jgi:hypothetical protein